MSRDEVIKLLALIRSTVYLGNRKFRKADEKQRLIDGIREQIKTGVVILPNGMRAITCDADDVLITTEATP